MNNFDWCRKTIENWAVNEISVNYHAIQLVLVRQLLTESKKNNQKSVEKCDFSNEEKWGIKKILITWIVVYFKNVVFVIKCFEIFERKINNQDFALCI